jgi:hypothetical protein
VHWREDEVGAVAVRATGSARDEGRLAATDAAALTVADAGVRRRVRRGPLYDRMR